ncbi:MAG: alpha/beta fold hydrolase [Planctomycetota bacterium]|nr:alpha/beta fold hydrolase [Planctomycetota bacterium]
MVWIILSISILILVDLFIYIYGLRVGLPIFDRTLPFAARIGEEDPAVESFFFPSADGRVLLKGSLFNSHHKHPCGLVLFCHEFGGNRWTARHYCEGLLSAGFSVVAFDFSQHGDSEQRDGYDASKWLTEYDVDDVNGAIDFIRTQPEWNELPFFLFGISKGAGAVLSAAARTENVSGVIVESAYSTRRLMTLHASRWLEYALGRRVKAWFPFWRVEMTLAVMRWISQRQHHCRYTNLERQLPALRSKPVFWLSGELDTYVKPSVIQELCQAAGGEPAVDVWIVPGARHNTARVQYPVEYDRRIVEFLERTGRLVQADEGDAVPASTVRVQKTSARQVSSPHV